MKKLLFILILITLSNSSFAESDVLINDRLLKIQKTICKEILNKQKQKQCFDLSKEFLPKTNILWTVEKVVDGDTLYLDYKGEKIKIRLTGVDTPETKSIKKGVQCYGPEAYEFTKSQLEGKKIRIRFDEIIGAKDIYDRYLAYVFLPGKTSTFNQSLIERGFAREYDYDGSKYELSVKFKDAGNKAKENKLGLWGRCLEE